MIALEAGAARPLTREPVIGPAREQGESLVDAQARCVEYERQLRALRKEIEDLRASAQTFGALAERLQRALAAERAAPRRTVGACACPADAKLPSALLQLQRLRLIHL